MSEHPPGDQPDGIEIEDPEDYSSSTRLQQIFEARRQLREIRREASTYRHSGVTKKEKMRAIQYYRSGVESYLLEVDTLLREHEPGKTLWNDKHFGTVTIQPPGNFEKKRGYYRAKNIEMKPNVPLKVTSIPDPKEVDIVGLKWLFETQSPISCTFKFPIKSSLMNDSYTTSASACIAWTTLNQMVSDVNSFLGDLGIGLNVDNTDEWKI